MALTRHNTQNILCLVLGPDRQIALTSKLKTMGLASMAPNPIILRYHFGNLCIEGLILLRPEDGRTACAVRRTDEVLTEL